MNKQRIISLSVFLVVVLAGIIVFSATRPKANVTLLMSPAAAKAVLDDNKTVKVGSFHITPGKHKITASFANFTSKTVSFTAPSSGAGQAQVTIILQASNDAGLAYLAKHTDDQGVREKVGGQDALKTNQQINKQYPIVSQLPYVGPGNSYRIDYGPAPGDGESNQVQITITYYLEGGRQAALDWIQSQGYDPSTLPIAYSNQTDDTSQTQIDNPYTN